jgi:hypothetical protein
MKNGESNYFVVGRKDVDDVLDLLQNAVRNWEEQNRRIIRTNCALQKSFLRERGRVSTLKAQYSSLLDRLETLESATDNPYDKNDEEGILLSKNSPRPDPKKASFMVGFEDLYDDSSQTRTVRAAGYTCPFGRAHA